MFVYGVYPNNHVTVPVTCANMFWQLQEKNMVSSAMSMCRTTISYAIQWLQILGNNIFLNLERQFQVTFYIGFSVGFTSYNL